MLHHVQSLNGLALHASDGDFGKVAQVYFDDARWVVRYLIVDSGSWLNRRTVLISPMSIGNVDWEKKRVTVNLTRQQVEDSPPVDAEKPVSRQHELEFARYYEYPLYWGGSALWGVDAYPLGFVGRWVDPIPPELAERIEQEQAAADHNLRSSKEVRGYAIHASDGSIGHVEDFIFDAESWAIRYIVVDTRDWLPGKKVLLSPEWITAIDWSNQAVAVGLTRETIETSPEYEPSAPLARDYEQRLFQHYERQGYWSDRRGN